MQIQIQSEEFPLRGSKIKAFFLGSFRLLDDCLDHQGSTATYASAKYLVHQDRAVNHTRQKVAQR